MTNIGQSMNSAHPIGLESVTYGVQDLEGARFIEEIGLTPAERGQRGATYLTGEGTAVHVRLSDDAALPPPIEGGSTIREVVWGVRSKADLDAIAAELSKDREVSRGAEGRLCSTDPNGLTISFQVTDRTVPPPQEPLVHAVNARAKFYDRATPDRLHHIAFYTPNLQEMVEFYSRRLGFQVSDTVTGLGAFLRCSADHHNIFLTNHHRKGLNHLAFRLRDIDEIMAGKQFLEKRGWRPVWGPGRHVVGSNLYYYFVNPCGGFMEYFADMDYITDPEAWTVREWPRTPEVISAWGPALPQEMMK